MARFPIITPWALNTRIIFSNIHFHKQMITDSLSIYTNTEQKLKCGTMALNTTYFILYKSNFVLLNTLR